MSTSEGSGGGRPVDVAASITLLIVAWALLACYAVIGLLLLAFLDHCPPESCSTDGAVNAVFLGGLVALGVLLALSILAAVRMFARRKAAWIALIGIVAVLGGGALGILRYAAAVG
jgi:hypothetical protein